MTGTDRASSALTNDQGLMDHPVRLGFVFAGAILVSLVPELTHILWGYSPPLFVWPVQIVGAIGCLLCTIGVIAYIYDEVIFSERIYVAGIVALALAFWATVTDIPWRWPLFGVIFPAAPALAYVTKDIIQDFKAQRTEESRKARKHEMRNRIRKHPRLYSASLAVLFVGAILCAAAAVLSRSNLWIRGLEALGIVVFAWQGGKILNQSRLAERFPWDQDLDFSGVGYLEGTKLQLQATQGALNDLAKKMNGSIAQLNDLMTSTMKLEQEADHWRKLASISKDQAAATAAELRKEGKRSVLWGFIFFLLGSAFTAAVAFWPAFMSFMKWLWLTLGFTGT